MNVVKVVFDGSPVNYEVEVLSNKLPPKTNIIVESLRGMELVKTVCTPFPLKRKHEQNQDGQENQSLKFIRIATKKDLEFFLENKKLAEEVKAETKNLARKYGLEMKVSEVCVLFDRSKIIVSFTAENRVDFRELVKELASKFRARIELRQIGSRDETRAMGGFGPCGKQCCCKQFLNDFEHVSIKMAKNQNLSLNPTKISGLCGRLLCCLGYENKHYEETNKLMPKINSVVETPCGKGKVVYNDLLKRIVQVKIGDENSFEVKNFDLTEIKRTKDGDGTKRK